MNSIYNGLPHSPFKLFREMFLKQIRQYVGDSDIEGIELAQLIHVAANIYNTVGADENEISGQRWEIMLRLLAEEKMGSFRGINPTWISKFRNVSKNTVSSLLRGLEEQELISRELDPQDKRAFLIKLTEKGRKMTEEITPRRLSAINQLSNVLSPQEKKQMVQLMQKLVRGIAEHQFKQMKKRGSYEEKD